MVKVMMRRIELWVVVGLLAVAIPVQAQQDNSKKQPSDTNTAAAQGAPKKPATDDPDICDWSAGCAGHQRLERAGIDARGAGAARWKNFDAIVERRAGRRSHPSPISC